MSKIERCSRCGEQIYRARLDIGGNRTARIAVNVTRRPHGTIQLVHLKLDDEPAARKLDAEELDALRMQQRLARLAGIDDEQELLLHVSHDSTCLGLKRERPKAKTPA